MTFRQSSDAAGFSPFTVRYDFSSGTYRGAAATVGTVTITGATAAQAGVGTIYLDPTTGAALGEDSPTGGSDDTITTYDPPDWQQRLTNAGIQGGSSGKISVTATVKGKSITDGFAALGGATAMVISYDFIINRDANETVSTAAGSFPNSCKFRVDYSMKSVRIEGPAASSPLLGIMLPTLQTAFVVPTRITFWSTSAIPFMMPKSITVMTLPAPAGTTTMTQELTDFRLAPR